MTVTAHFHSVEHLRFFCHPYFSLESILKRLILIRTSKPNTLENLVAQNYILSYH